MTQVSTVSELLPCPFCGSDDLGHDGPSYTQIMCNDCGAHEYEQPDRASAIAAWNRRATREASGDWVMAPREPTEAMVKAAHETHQAIALPKLTYAAMLAAAPTPPAEKDGAEAMTSDSVLSSERLAELAAYPASPGHAVTKNHSTHAQRKWAAEMRSALTELLSRRSLDDGVEDAAEALYDDLLPLMQADAPDVYGSKVKAQAAIINALSRTRTTETGVRVKPLEWEKSNVAERWVAQYPPPSVVQVTEAARDVLAERQRQVEAEGWTPEHDDKHSAGELARAAGVYALAAGSHDYRWVLRHTPVNDYLAAAFKLWPWDRSWFKPTDRRRDMVKAGALILAEIERLDRAALTVSQEKE